MKKKIVIICLLSVLTSISIKAQTDTLEYDTLIYYPQEVLGCPTWVDSFDISSIDYQTTQYLMCARDACCETPFIDGRRIIAPNTVATGFAQSYHLIDTAKICGVAARVFGDIPSVTYQPCYFIINGVHDSNNYAYAQLPVFNPVPVYPGITTTTHLEPLPRHYLNRTIDLRDFYISVKGLVWEDWENPTVGNMPYTFDHSCTFDYDPCDSLCYYFWFMPNGGPDYHIGCDVKESPLLLDKYTNEWRHFEDDTLYVHYRRMFIAWYPILLIPRAASSSLNRIDVSNICNIFPNPASTYLKLVSEVKVKHIEIYNITGAKVREEDVNEFGKAIDISSLPAGSYVMTIHTTQGTAEKKFVKE